MKKNLLFALLFYYTFTNAQISFEKGYFISNNGKRTECYIRNLDWKGNPKEFKYKLQLNDPEVKIENIATTEEFGIDTENKYKRFKIKIDRSDDDIKKITTNRDPDWREETIFLKILVEGDATLYSYSENNTNRFFYSTKTIPTEQLIYVRYIIADQNEGAEKISENNEYKQQLFKNVKSSDITQKEILNLSYKKAPLTNYFLKYNNISSNSNEKEETKKSKNHVFIKITPGISTVSSKMKNDVASEFNTKLDNKIVFRFGAEVEYVLPTNKNKWSVFINPTYQKYENERSYNVQGNLTSNPVIPYKMEINYTSVQLPIGVRHYMFLNSNSKIFINASYSFDISTKTDITYTNMSNNSQVNFNGSSSNNIAFGLGYNFKNKFTAEARLNTTKELVNYTYYSAKYSAIDFIFGYTIF